MVTLVAFTKKGERKDLPVEEGTSIIGRTPESDIRVPADDVSRRHAQIAVSNGKASLKDLGSSNGTFVNEKKVTEAKLSPGDRIRIGPVTFVVQIDGKPSDVRPIPAPTAPKAKTPSAPASAEAKTTITPPPSAAADDSGSEVIDVDDLDVDELSDFDIGDISPIDDSSELEELDEADLIDDSDAGDQPKKK